MPSLGDYEQRMIGKFGPAVTQAILKLNGICYCAQCKVKLLALEAALANRVKPELRREGLDKDLYCENCFRPLTNSRCTCFSCRQWDVEQEGFHESL